MSTIFGAILKLMVNQQKLIEFMEQLLKDTIKKVFLILDNLKVTTPHIIMLIKQLTKPNFWAYDWCSCQRIRQI
jgi:hypothetical protein